MKWVAVAMMLAGSIFAQTKPPSQIADTSRQPTINIGIDLQLGMSRDAIISQLPAQYTIVKIHGDGDEWMVEEKEEPKLSIGHLGFTAGKLTYASRLWTQGQGDSYSFARALWDVMSQVDKADQHSCVFEVPAARSATAETSYMRLYCGPKKIDIVAVNVLDGTGKRHYTSISEVLSSEGDR